MGDSDTIEIDYHFRLFGKRADEIVYRDDDECPLCHSRIDERGWCGCDTIGGD